MGPVTRNATGNASESGRSVAGGASRPGMPEGLLRPEISRAPGYAVLCNGAIYSALQGGREEYKNSILWVVKKIGLDNTISVLSRDFASGDANGKFTQETYDRACSCLRMLETEPGAAPAPITDPKGYELLCREGILEAISGANHVKAALELATAITPTIALGVLLRISTESNQGEPVLQRARECKDAILRMPLKPSAPVR